jgi:hypothetical protein
LWIAAAGFVIVSALYVAQQWIPDPPPPAPATSAQAADTTTVATPPSAAASPSSQPPLDLIALIVGGVGLLAGVTAWWQVTGVSPAAEADRAVRESEVEAADRLTGAVAPTLRSASEFCQLAQMNAQLGEEAPEDLEERVAAARQQAEDHRERLQTELMRGAALLPNRVLQTAHEIDRMIEALLTDERLARMQGAALSTELQVAYYTFAGTIRSRTGLDGLNLETILGSEEAGGEAISSSAEAEAKASGTAEAEG